MIVPPSYTAQYDNNYPVSIFTLTDITGTGLSLDIFVNDDYFIYT